MHGCKQARMNHICQVYEIKEDVRRMWISHFLVPPRTSGEQDSVLSLSEIQLN